MDIPLTNPQKGFVLSTAPHPAIVGGLGSGKSRAGTFRIVMLMIEQRGLNAVYGMPSYDLLSLRAIPGTEDDLRSLGIDYTTNKSSYTIHMHGYGDIIFRSYDRPERWVAFECAHGVLDELDILTKDKASLVWRKVTERIRQKCKRGNTLSVVCTPDQGTSGFVYDKWVKNPPPGYVLFKASTYSNPFLPAGYADQILANYDPILAQLYLEGEFVSLTANKVYHHFNRTTHHSDRVITANDHYLHVGQDFNIGACCSTVFVIDGGYPIAVDEFVSHDTRDLCIQLSSRYPGKHVTIYPDASGQSRHTNASESDIDILRAAGFTVMVNGMNPAIRDRINAVNGLLAHGKMKVNTNTCQHLSASFESQGYDKKGQPEKFDTHPAIDDWVDCAGYFISYRYPVAGVGGISRLTGY